MIEIIEISFFMEVNYPLEEEIAILIGNGCLIMFFHFTSKRVEIKVMSLS